MKSYCVRQLKFTLVLVLYLFVGWQLYQLCLTEPADDKQTGALMMYDAPDENTVATTIATTIDWRKGFVSKQFVDNLGKDAKIDWENKELITADAAREGRGEQGEAVLLTAEEERKKEYLYNQNGFNALISDIIPLRRALKDIRHPQCRAKKYLAHLPNVSVVIPFHNEHWTTLLRTVHTVIERAPDFLVHEVILADDCSKKVKLKKALDDYVATHFRNVRVVRAKQREGLIRARLLGAKAATGEVIVFLDSHCETNVNWLPPLLDPIAKDYRTVVCPFIDVIDFETFSYKPQDEGARGAFDWNLVYKRLPLLKKHLANPSEPFDSPVMAGGLFAISRRWFWELGGYDPGLDIWGGEQYELSFKIWQCGGRLVDAPCSRIGHIYRKFSPFPNPRNKEFLGVNFRRVAEVWMDEYAEYLYDRRPEYRDLEPGDLTDRKEIRSRLKCKSFKWFLETVAFDLLKFYPPVEPPNAAEGEVSSVANPRLCLDAKFAGEQQSVGLDTCVSMEGEGQQGFAYGWRKDIRPKERDSECFDVSSPKSRSMLTLYSCHGLQGNQRFQYLLHERQLYHPATGLCLDADIATRQVFMMTCNKELRSQQWQFERVNKTLVKEYNSN